MIAKSGRLGTLASEPMKKGFATRHIVESSRTIPIEKYANILFYIKDVSEYTHVSLREK